MPKWLGWLAAFGIAAGVGWVGWEAIRPTPKLDARRFDALLASGRADAAEALLRDHLRRAPDRADAKMRLASWLVDRVTADEPEADARRKAKEALHLLERVRVQDLGRAFGPKPAALVWLYQGKALYVLMRWDEAEASFREALRIDPTVPEAGWALLDMYYLQGRGAEARRLALRLHADEPDPHDRAQLLLELVRQDALDPAAWSLVEQFEKVNKANPDDVRSALALGLARVHNSQADAGLDLLAKTVRKHPSEPAAWDALLTGLNDAGRPEQIESVLSRLPAALASDVRFAKHRAVAARQSGDWATAIALFEQARKADPSDPKLVYKLARTYRLAGQVDKAAPLEALDEAYKSGVGEVRSLYQEANAVETLGTRPHPELCRRLGWLRERMLRPEEAKAWYRMALKDAPDDPEASAGLKRLE